MTPTKEDVKKWLKAIGKDRFWLAEQCGTTKRTVDDWLSTGRAIPAKAVLVIQQLMNGGAESSPRLVIEFTDEEWAIICDAMKAHKETFLEFINTAIQNAAKEKEAARRQFAPMETPPIVTPLSYAAQIIGNTAAGKPTDGGTSPQEIFINRPLERGEYVLRVNGKSMEPKIPDGSLVIVKKYEDYLFPKIGTLVVYSEGNDYTLKKLAKRKNPETGETEYVLKSINPAYKDVEPIAEGKISGLYVETLENWSKA